MVPLPDVVVVVVEDEDDVVVVALVVEVVLPCGGLLLCSTYSSRFGEPAPTLLSAKKRR